MASGPREPGRIRRFFQRIRNFLSARQFSKTRAAYRSTTGQSPPPITREPPARPAPTAREPVAQRRAPEPVAAREAREIEREQKRIEELRRIEIDARQERESLETKTAAQQPPTRDLEDFEKRKGFQYHTWFKAFGTFGDLRDMGDSPTLLGEMEELEDMDVPAAFYSSAKLGKVKWPGIKPLAELIEELGDAVFGGADFRDIYPRWEYRYYVAEGVGNVVVQIYERKARQPLDKKARSNGYKPN